MVHASGKIINPKARISPETKLRFNVPVYYIYQWGISKDKVYDCVVKGNGWLMREDTGCGLSGLLYRLSGDTKEIHHEVHLQGDEKVRWEIRQWVCISVE